MKDSRPQNTQLFTLRIWIEKLNDDQHEWRGQLHHIPSGRIDYFRRWVELVPLILSAIRRHTGDQAANSEPADLWDDTLDSEHPD